MIIDRLKIRFFSPLRLEAIGRKTGRLPVLNDEILRKVITLTIFIIIFTVITIIKIMISMMMMMITFKNE